VGFYLTKKTGKCKKETDKDKNMRTECFHGENVRRKTEAGTFAELMAETELL
jgi:hypothetical protein